MISRHIKFVVKLCHYPKCPRYKASHAARSSPLYLDFLPATRPSFIWCGPPSPPFSTLYMRNCLSSLEFPPTHTEKQKLTQTRSGFNKRSLSPPSSPFVCISFATELQWIYSGRRRKILTNTDLSVLMRSGMCCIKRCKHSKGGNFLLVKSPAMRVQKV